VCRKSHHHIVIWRYDEAKKYIHRKMIIVYFAVQIIERQFLPRDGREFAASLGALTRLGRRVHARHYFLVTARRDIWERSLIAQDNKHLFCISIFDKRAIPPAPMISLP